MKYIYPKIFETGVCGCRTIGIERKRIAIGTFFGMLVRSESAGFRIYGTYKFPFRIGQGVGDGRREFKRTAGFLRRFGFGHNPRRAIRRIVGFVASAQAGGEAEGGE
jgi:hypothetical protein